MRKKVAFILWFFTFFFLITPSYWASVAQNVGSIRAETNAWILWEIVDSLFIPDGTKIKLEHLENNSIWIPNFPLTQITHNGNVWIGITDPSAMLEVSGNITVASPINANHVANKQYVDTKLPSSNCTSVNSKLEYNNGVWNCVDIFDWNVSTWSVCGSTCGTSTQTRTVVCEDDFWNAVPEAKCSTAKPIVSQPCTNTTGCTYSWYNSGWSGCNASCWWWSQSRTVYCRRSDGFNAWTHSTTTPCWWGKPATSNSCYAWACGPTYYHRSCSFYPNPSVCTSTKQCTERSTSSSWPWSSYTSYYSNGSCAIWTPISY